MEIFRTVVPVSPSSKKLHYASKTMFLGSCFSEYIGNRIADVKFSIDSNPFGIVYNPLSIALQLNRLMRPIDYIDTDLFLNDELWCSFDHHGKFSDTNKETCLTVINQRLKESHIYLKEADFLLLTFGTSYVYYLKDTNRVVANCHKVPAQQFDRRRIVVQDIVSTYSDLIKQLTVFNPNIQIVFTVSPIRHWKDGPHENQLSKAILLLAVDELCHMYSNTCYFPSYELVMDDLRDYRFYAEDMFHPNSLAINYIWGRFKECFMEPDTIQLMKEVEKIIQASRHKPFNSKTEAFQSFARQFYDNIQHLKKQYHITFDPEEEHFKSFL